MPRPRKPEPSPARSGTGTAVNFCIYILINCLSFNLLISSSVSPIPDNAFRFSSVDNALNSSSLSTCFSSSSDEDEDGTPSSSDAEAYFSAPGAYTSP